MSLAPEKSRTSVEKIVNTLVKSLSHRHASVRVAAVQAIGECYFVDTSSFKETWPSIKKLLLDDQSLVRYQIYTLARDWQLRLIDRYSYAMYMLFFLLHGLREEIDDLRFVCESALPMISELYEKDWESRLKDQLNYNPNKDKLIGFRELVRENMLALTDFIVEDLYHWTVEVRHCAAKVLSGLVLYAREHISGYLGKLFPALHRVVHDPFQTLILEITEEIGSFISPELLLHLLLPSIKNTSTLILITSALQKSNCTEFHVNKLLESLAQNFESDVSQSELLTPLFLTILSKSNSLSPDGLHRRLIFILGVQLNEPTVLTAIEASPLSIFEESKPCLLSLPLAELQTSRHHPTFLLFKKMLLNCPPSFFDKDLLPPLMQLSDVNMLLEILPVLLKRSNLFSFEFCSLLWPFLILHLKWNGGKLFFQLRELVAELAVLCINQDSLSIILDPLTDALTSAMDDERLITRKHYLSLTEQVLLSQSLTSEHLKKLYCEILKRLDDASDEIRVQACHLIQSIFLRCSIVNSLDHIHIDEIIKKITIHIDDQNPMIQNAAASTLLSINALYPDLVKVHLASVKQYFRNQSMIQQYF
ncbi:HEAT repeat-containing protein 2 [Coelomomyces lativittatus]|nr:HEAT repeat-containing protein 2 [Coelomomyces lativittatus]